MSLSTSLQTVTLGIGAIIQFVKANWIALLICAVVVGVGMNRFDQWRSERKSTQADAKVVELQKEAAAFQEERERWAVERARLLGQADRDHAEGELNDAKAEATKALVAQQGTAVRDAELKKIEAIDAELKRDQAITSADISDSERCERVRAKYAAQGIKFECRP